MSLSLYPFNQAAAITPHDTTDIGGQGITDAVYVGGAGNLVAVFQDGSTATLNAVLAGHVYYLRVKRINSTNTTATNLLALYRV